MRAIWSGGISFGLIYIPVKLYPATESVALDLDILDKRDNAPVGYKKYNKNTGEDVSKENIIKGFQVKKGKYVLLDDEDFEKANVEKSKSIKIEQFVEEKEIDSKYFEKPYYLEPDEKAKHTYALLHDALKKSKKVGVAKFVLRNREHLCLLKPEDNVMMLVQMRFISEIRDFDDLDLPGTEKINKQELDMAIEIINKLTTEFEPKKYEDSYIDDLKDLIKKKSKTKVVKVKGSVPKPTSVDELMKKLEASLDIES